MRSPRQIPLSALEELKPWTASDALVSIGRCIEPKSEANRDFYSFLEDSLCPTSRSLGFAVAVDFVDAHFVPSFDLDYFR